MATRTAKVESNGDAGSAFDQQIVLRRLEKRTLEVPIEGVSPLIVHRFSEKAKKMMLDAQTGKARTKKPPKDPQAEYEASMYRLEDGRHGFPGGGFKAAIVNAISQFDGLTKVLGKQSLTVIGEGPEQLVPIVGEPTMREDTVRLQGSTADLRYRAQYWPWSAVLTIRYLATALSDESVIALVDAAGSGGIGEWRPSAPRSGSGSYGCFEVTQ